MSFKIVLLPPDVDVVAGGDPPDRPRRGRQGIRGAPQDALTDIEDADAAYGTVPPSALRPRQAALDLRCPRRPGWRLVL